MEKVTIYTDGACSGNPGPGGWGSVLIYNGNEKAENVISDLVRIYIGASFIIIGIIYKLGKNK